MMPKWVKYVGAGLALVAGILWALLFRRSGPSPVERFRERSEVIDAEAEAKKAQAQLGTERAVAEVKAKHAEAMRELEKEGEDRVRELEKDPSKLAGAAMRALQRSRARR